MEIGILCRLQEGPARLGDLRRLFPGASKKMLTQHLRQMEQDRLIVRTDLSGKVPHVEHSLSELRGLGISRLFSFLATWSTEYPSQVAPDLSRRGAWIADPKSDQCRRQGSRHKG